MTLNNIYSWNKIILAKGIVYLESTHQLLKWLFLTTKFWCAVAENLGGPLLKWLSKMIFCWPLCSSYCLDNRDNVFMEINRTICWLQISFKKIPKGLFTPCIHITAIEPDIKIIKPTFCSHNNSKTFIQPKLSLNFTVGAHLLSPFSGSLWLWLKLVTNNKQQFPCLVGIAHPHLEC